MGPKMGGMLNRMGTPMKTESAITNKIRDVLVMANFTDTQGDRYGSSGSWVGLMLSTSIRGTTWPSVEGNRAVPTTSSHCVSFQSPETFPPSSTEAGWASAAQHHMIQRTSLGALPGCATKRPTVRTLRP